MADSLPLDLCPCGEAPTVAGGQAARPWWVECPACGAASDPHMTAAGAASAWNAGRLWTHRRGDLRRPFAWVRSREYVEPEAIPAALHYKSVGEALRCLGARPVFGLDPGRDREILARALCLRRAEYETAQVRYFEAYRAARPSEGGPGFIYGDAIRLARACREVARARAMVDAVKDRLATYQARQGVLA